MSQQNLDNVCNEEIFDGIFRAESKDLHNFLYYKFGGDNNPKDIVQEAFIKLWNNCAKVVPEKARSFLFTVANNHMLNELSKKKTALAYQKEKPKEYTIESPEYIMEGNEYMQKLQTALEDLTEEQRVTFLMNRVDGKKHQEIANLLGISKKAVEKRIYTALKILRTKLGNL